MTRTRTGGGAAQSEHHGEPLLQPQRAAPGGDTPGQPSWTGVRLGVDVGTVRVGVARSDPDGLLASPLCTLDRDDNGQADAERLRDLVAEDNVVEVVVGLPRTLRGTEGAAATAARDYGGRLADLIAPVPVVYQDERMTTVLAHRTLADQGMNSRRRRHRVDQTAAAAILQARLDGLRGGAA